ncbi:6-phosphogluconate dehydrogenase [Salinihabitans flavidus]|uniref:6-phosphogluconate dehydrogenase, decarboxylating n=1 Tax=Salinihabitans flavidus TaxID=569882 RepID=A0A1H8MQ32_9RHOB|nr:NADP-dependent phosphogluconate dehydrogenase [Salinihabitans flavidus]SEO19380.1 6-phosphogluconate dehydrogenase [Salinihabitans flavidus]
MQADIGVYGLGTMGGALSLNLAEKGFRVAVSNREADWIAPFVAGAGPLAERIVPREGLEAFIAALTPPRVVLFMIPSGTPLDEMIAQVTPLLSPGDTIIDAGNADFNDTERRARALAEKSLHFVGLGISGGEEGARHGPSMMFGGSAESWDRLRPMAEAIAARYRGDPCVAHLGPGGAGHFVKTVHNGIEYADMQMIAEIYGLLRDGAGWEAGRIGALFSGWNAGPLRSFLIEVTAAVLKARDAGTGAPVVDAIRDRAAQKGTGRWTMIEALKLGQAPSTIAAAVDARVWSSQHAARTAVAGAIPAGARDVAIPASPALEEGLRAARILAHLQGFELLRAASGAFGWALDLPRIAEIWRAGCIIRSALLDELAEALRAVPEGAPLLLGPGLDVTLARTVPALRAVVGAGVAGGWPVPALAAALAWYDSMRQARGSANLIQAQRDFFGHHGFERIDAPGPHHGPWTAKD